MQGFLSNLFTTIPSAPRTMSGIYIVLRKYVWVVQMIIKYSVLLPKLVGHHKLIKLRLEWLQNFPGKPTQGWAEYNPG